MVGRCGRAVFVDQPKWALAALKRQREHIEYDYRRNHRKHGFNQLLYPSLAVIEDVQYERNRENRPEHQRLGLHQNREPVDRAG